MRRRAAEFGTISLSFVDCVASALGAVIFLMLIVSILGRYAGSVESDESVRLDVLTSHGPEADAPGFPCAVLFFLSPPDEGRTQHSTGPFVPVEGKTGGSPLAAFQEAKALGNARVATTDDFVRSVLWADGLRAGKWRAVLRLKALEEAVPPGGFFVTVRLRIGGTEIGEWQVRMLLSKPGLQAFSFKELKGVPSEGDALVFEIAPAVTRSRSNSGRRGR